MKATIKNLFNSINQALNLINRMVNTTDALLATAEAHSLAFRDSEMADLQANESDALKAYRAAQAS